MPKISHGFRHRTRFKLRSELRAKFTAERFLKTYETGATVAIHHDPASRKGMPHPRFKGLVGKVIERRGDSYVVDVRIGKKPKTIVARPEHLKEIKKTKA